MIEWSGVQTVLLDMDGTLLDLHYDTHFWLTHLPNRYAETRGIPVEQARSQITGMIEREQGSLNWYCLDYWSAALDMDVGALKHEIQDRIRFREDAPDFLRALKESHCRVVLVTNAHQHGLQLKLRRTGLEQWLDGIHTTHSYGLPKEDPAFWPALHAQEPFEPDRTLLVDDNHAALRSAAGFGIRHLLSITVPDSQQPPRASSHWPGISRFSEILPIPSAKSV